MTKHKCVSLPVFERVTVLKVRTTENCANFFQLFSALIVITVIVINIIIIRFFTATLTKPFLLFDFIIFHLFQLLFQIRSLQLHIKFEEKNSIIFVWIWKLFLPWHQNSRFSIYQIIQIYEEKHLKERHNMDKSAYSNSRETKLFDFNSNFVLYLTGSTCEAFDGFP